MRRPCQLHIRYITNIVLLQVVEVRRIKGRERGVRERERVHKRERAWRKRESVWRAREGAYAI